MAAVLFWLICLAVSGSAQGAPPQSERLQPVSAPLALFTSGPSTSGTQMPVPEGGTLANGTYRSEYFGFSYALPLGWEESFAGPPPSDTGYYVLAQFKHTDTSPGSSPGTILITAADKFFSFQATETPKEVLEGMRARLGSIYQVEAPPTEFKLGQRTFVRLDYQAPAAELHWRILASEMRCHILEFIFTSRDPRLLDSLVQSVERMQLSPAGGSGPDENEVPLCIQDYATGPNLIHRVDPIFVGPKFTNIPARIVIDRNGRVKHIHVISAFPAQAENIKSALAQWRFKPYVRNGGGLEVETGVLFGFPPRGRNSPAQRPDSAGRSWR
jgi:hypothetical protein